MGFNFDAIRPQLLDAGDGIFREMKWLEDSWDSPDDFNAALLEYQSQTDPAPFKSKRVQGYDFYHDLVLRHVNTERVALMWLDSTQQLRKLTYGQLHTLCTQRRAEWIARGVDSGSQVVVLANMGPELVVPLLTTLRMGATAVVLPPAGIDFLTRRIKQLGSPFVACASRYVPLLRSLALQREPLIERTDVSSVEQATADATSYTYPPDSPVFRIYSPVQKIPDMPTALKASDCYAAALRDGLLLLGLNPGHIVAQTESLNLQFQPTLLMSIMLRGAGLLQLSASDFERDLRRDDPLANLPPVHVLFANASMRATMLAAPPRPVFKDLQLWVANAQEAPNPTAWSDWAARWSLQGVPAMALIYDTACGGALMFTLRHFGTPTGYLMPVPGREFELLQPDGSDTPARSNYGMFKPSFSSIPLLLTKLEGGYLYAGTAIPTNQGRASPKEEVEEAVQDLSFVRGASLVQEPGDRGQSTLLLFTGPETLGWAKMHMRQRMMLAEHEIIHRLSHEHLPTRIVVSSTLPRIMHGGKLDHHWAAQMFRSGELSRRGSNPIYSLLDRLLLTLMPALDRKLK